jgi:hypothetical protein
MKSCKLKTCSSTLTKKKRMGVWRFDYNGITKLNQGEINMYKPKKGY